MIEQNYMEQIYKLYIDDEDLIIDELSEILENLVKIKSYNNQNHIIEDITNYFDEKMHEEAKLDEGCFGHLYCLFNEMFNYYGDNVYKLGKTINLKKRKEQYVTPYIKPSQYIHSTKKVHNYKLAEDLLFLFLDEYRIVPNREFFKCPIEIIRDNMEKIVDIFENNKKDELIINWFPTIIKTKIKRMKKKFKKYFQEPNINDMLNSYNLYYLGDKKLRALPKKYKIIVNKNKASNLLNTHLISNNDLKIFIGKINHTDEDRDKIDKKLIFNKLVLDDNIKKDELKKILDYFLAEDRLDKFDNVIYWVEERYCNINESEHIDKKYLRRFVIIDKLLKTVGFNSLFDDKILNVDNNKIVDIPNSDKKNYQKLFRGVGRLRGNSITHKYYISFVSRLLDFHYNIKIHIFVDKWINKKRQYKYKLFFDDIFIGALFSRIRQNVTRTDKVQQLFDLYSSKY